MSIKLSCYVMSFKKKNFSMKWYGRVGVPTFKKILSDWAGWYIFCTTFHEDSKNINFFKIGHTQSTPKLCPAWLLIKTEQASWAELGRRLGVSNLEKICIFGIHMKSCTKYVSAIKIRDVAGTPNGRERRGWGGHLLLFVLYTCLWQKCASSTYRKRRFVSFGP